MKQSDIITIALISGIAIFASFVLVNNLLGNPDEASVSFKTIKPVTSEVAEPNPEVFNRDALNPTVEVSISGCEDSNGNGILEEDELENCVINSTEITEGKGSASINSTDNTDNSDDQNSILTDENYENNTEE